MQMYTDSFNQSLSTTLGYSILAVLLLGSLRRDQSIIALPKACSAILLLKKACSLMLAVWTTAAESSWRGQDSWTVGIIQLE